METINWFWVAFAILLVFVIPSNGEDDGNNDGDPSVYNAEEPRIHPDGLGGPAW